MTTIEATQLTSFPAHTPRLDEYNECLERNCRHKNIGKIVLLYEGSEEDRERFVYKHPKIGTIFVSERPSIQRMVDYGNGCAPGSYVIVANADIYFDDESNLHRLAEMKKGGMWALTRYDYDQEKKRWKILHGDWGSYDAYIFQSPLKKFKCRDLVVGYAGCDSYFVSAAIAGGIPVANPALSIVSKHLHHPTSTRNHCWWSKKHQKNISYHDFPEYRRIVSGRIATVSAISDKKYCTRFNDTRRRILAFCFSLAGHHKIRTNIARAGKAIRTMMGNAKRLFKQSSDDQGLH